MSDRYVSKSNPVEQAKRAIDTTMTNYSNEAYLLRAIVYLEARIAEMEKRLDQDDCTNDEIMVKREAMTPSMAEGVRLYQELADEINREAKP